VAETVRVIRGEGEATYVIAEEHADGALLLRLAPAPPPPSAPSAPPPEARGAVASDAPAAVTPAAPAAVASEAPAAVASEARGTAPSPEAILEVQDLTVAYGAKVAVSEVTFQIRRGEIFGLLGPNGAGKTSTLSAVEGLIKPRSGTVLLDGLDIRRNALEAKSRMGVQLQATSFQAELTIKQIIRLYAGLYGLALDDEEITRRLREVGLYAEADKPFKQLSGGQQQRLALQIAVVHEPALLLLDEPTAGLDPQSRRQLWGRIEHLRQQGGSILLTTHSMEEAQAVCDRVAIIDHGTLLTAETPRDLIQKHKDDPRVREVARGPVTLEDVFIGLTGSEIRD
jgi:ABC-2 type transport system ATP-binding protein